MLGEDDEADKSTAQEIRSSKAGMISNMEVLVQLEEIKNKLKHVESRRDLAIMNSKELENQVENLEAQLGKCQVDRSTSPMSSTGE